MMHLPAIAGLLLELWPLLQSVDQVSSPQSPTDVPLGAPPTFHHHVGGEGTSNPSPRHPSAPRLGDPFLSFLRPSSLCAVSCSRFSPWLSLTTPNSIPEAILFFQVGFRSPKMILHLPSLSLFRMWWVVPRVTDPSPSHTSLSRLPL